MDAHALAVLEFAQVRALLAEGAASALGLEAVAALEPVVEGELVALRQRRTSEARRVLDEGQDIPLGGLHDVRGEVAEAALGRTVDPPGLLQVAETARCIETVRAFLAEREQLPALRELADQLVPLPGLAAEIERCLTPEGEVADDASAELRRLRQQARALANRLQSSLRRILSDLAGSDAVQDPVVTIREGRYCVPIKSSHQGQFQGLIHDRSASGATVFMEPAEVVKLNNELREAQLAERDEVERILRELTGRVAAAADDLGHDLRLMTTIDLSRACGRLSQRLDAVEPALDGDGRFELRQARHPLLAARGGVVPVDLALGGTYRTLLITGPNTGGKTVSLKTLGLLTLMAQAGLHVPAEAESRIAICREVFADIGDEQSLEQSLSTFGSHLRQIVAILRTAEAGDLVLLDEVGAGTDPTEGAALAEALLNALHERGCRVVATTHHGSLKRFAYETDGVENASVEFDGRTLAPTFRLLTGIPGASHAFEIADRYGLPGEVLDEARKLLPAEHVEAAELIGEMQASRRRLEGEMRAAEHEAAKASHERRELEQERRRLRELERELRDQAKRDAARLLDQVRGEADQILTDLRRAEREGRQTESARRRLRELGEALAQPAETRIRRRQTGDAPPAVGDVVLVLRLNAEAEVLRVAETGELEVRAGALRMTVTADEIELVRRGPAARPPAAGRVVSAGPSIDLELHLRGQTVDEALVNLDRYLDQAMLSHLPEVRIVHGKGTGTLKRVVQEFLKQHPYVKSYGHPPESLGGGGVTVAKLDD